MADNPNLPFTGWAQDSVEPNRAYDVRRDNDTFKTPSITIYDVDFAILHYLKNEIDPKVEQAGVMIDVPVIYASSEIWSQIQGNGYMRDKQGKLLAPYMVLRRTSMSEDDRFRKLDVNSTPAGSEIVIRPKQRNFENIRDKHPELQNSKFTDEFFISVIPEFYKVEYELYIFTYLTEQLNSIVEAIIPVSNFIWGDSYKFRTLVGDFSFDTINPTNTERIVQATVNLTVDARLQAEYELKKSTIRKAYGIKRLVIRNERSSFDFKVVSEFPNE